MEVGSPEERIDWGLSSAILCFSQGLLPAVQTYSVVLTCADHHAMHGVQQPWVRMALTPHLLRRCLSPSWSRSQGPLGQRTGCGLEAQLWQAPLASVFLI